MIISCPACATRYVVPDSAIGLEGRTVRCAKCKHSWYQDGPDIAEPIAAAYAPEPSGTTVPSAAPVASPAANAGPDGVPPAATPPVPNAAPTPPPVPLEAPTEPAYQRNVPSFDETPPEVNRSNKAAPIAPDGETEVSQFDHAPPFRRRRNWLKVFTWGAASFAALAIAALVVMTTLGVPSWLPIEKPLYGADPGLTVEFPPAEQERRTLPNGAEFFGARVVVKNDARETKTVPPLLIVLRDARERVVYSWELIPPQKSLAPGEAMTINEAMTDVPKSAVFADIGWAPR